MTDSTPLTKEEILSWLNRYNEEEGLDNNNEEADLQKRFQINQYITKDDLVRIIRWKYQKKLAGRQKRHLIFIAEADSPFIEDVSRLVFKYNNDESRLKLLYSIEGVGNALASIILTFYEPQNYGIIDNHSWFEIFRERKPANISSNTDHAIRLFKKLREISSQTGISCRDIERAYFKRDLEGWILK